MLSPIAWSLFDQLGELSLQDQQSTHAWANLEIHSRLLEELVKRKQYKDSEELKHLFLNQRILKMLRRYRKTGLL